MVADLVPLSPWRCSVLRKEIKKRSYCFTYISNKETPFHSIRNEHVTKTIILAVVSTLTETP